MENTLFYLFAECEKRYIYHIYMCDHISGWYLKRTWRNIILRYFHHISNI